VARNIFRDDPEPVDYRAIPYAVFASPEVAGVGAHEEDLRTSETEFATNVYRYEETARGNAMKAEGSRGKSSTSTADTRLPHHRPRRLVADS